MSIELDPSEGMEDNPLHAPALERVMDEPDANGLLAVFYGLIEEAEQEGRTVGQCCMPFIDADDEFVEGTWVPEFWFIVRKVLPDDKPTD